MIVEKLITDYYADGFEVFPAFIKLIGTKKIIITPSGTSWKEKLTMETTIHWLRALEGKVNALCIKTGICSSVTVIDDDNRKQIHPILSNLKEGETPHSITGCGGHHFFFRYDHTIPTSACHSEKIDIRNNNGLIILPPSCFGGRGYSWITQLKRNILQPIPVSLKEFLLSLHKIDVTPINRKNLKSYKELSHKQREILDGYIKRSRCAKPGRDDRSACDFALCCWAVKISLRKDELWKRVSGISKFAQRGEEYFNLTFENAIAKLY